MANSNQYFVFGQIVTKVIEHIIIDEKHLCSHTYINTQENIVRLEKYCKAN